MKIDTIMPEYVTTVGDEYLCTAVPLPDHPMKLVSIEPLSEQNTVHHMLLFGCAVPARSKPVWMCGKMSPVCDGQDNVLYSWGKNAPTVHLPPGTGFSVGPGSSARTVVLQIHYLTPRGANDASGIRLGLTSNPAPFSAGMVVYTAGHTIHRFTIPPGDPEYLVPNECCYSGFEPLKGFAFRVHTHALGQSVYLEGDGDLNGKELQKLAQQNPQLPQGFYPIEPADHAVRAGHTAKDEMCILYLMLYSELPFFSWCVRNSSQNGPRGIAPHSELVVEDELWSPPVKQKPLAESAGQVQVGQIAGLAAPPTGNASIWAFTRATRTWTGNTFDTSHHMTKARPIGWPVVMQLDRDTGRLLSSWGQDTFYMPHMITVDREGNLWTVDTGAHQVFKHSADGQLLMSLGQALTPGKDEASFCQPTHVVLSRNGTIFVGDGYCNSRIVRFSPDGIFEREYILEMGLGRAAMPLPHSLALDECKQRLWIGDREARRVLALNIETGGVDGEWTDLPSAGVLPYALRLGPYGTPIVLAWDREGADTTWIVSIEPNNPGKVIQAWPAPGVHSPHDLEIAPAPLEVSSVGERLLAVVIAETTPEGGKIHKFVLTHGAGSTEAEESDEEEDESGKRPAGLETSHVGHTMLKPAVGQTAAGTTSRSPSSSAKAKEDSVDVDARHGDYDYEVLRDRVHHPNPNQTRPAPLNTLTQEEAALEDILLAENTKRVKLDSQTGSLSYAMTKFVYGGVVLGVLTAALAALLLRKAGYLSSLRRRGQSLNQDRGGNGNSNGMHTA